MKTLVVVRHGAYLLDDQPRELTERGREQIRVTCEKLALFSGQNLFMLVSAHERTIESAEIIAQALNIPPERIERMSGLEVVDERTVAKVRAKFDAADVLIVVGHQVTVENLPAYLEMDTELIAPYAIEKGGGVIMDCATKAMEWF